MRAVGLLLLLFFICYFVKIVGKKQQAYYITGSKWWALFKCIRGVFMVSVNLRHYFGIGFFDYIFNFYLRIFYVPIITFFYLKENKVEKTEAVKK